MSQDSIQSHKKNGDLKRPPVRTLNPVSAQHKSGVNRDGEFTVRLDDEGIDIE
jgi:hypothetical protein